MIKRIRVMMAAVLLLVCIAGCGTGDAIYLERAKTDTESASGTEEDELSAECGNAAETRPMGQENVTVTQTQEECYVYVCGAVFAPGVYVLAPGARIYEAIAQAGGLTEDAGITAVNQAQEVCDGLMIYIPTKEEAAAYPLASEQKQDGVVNLNTASETELMTLPGIGQTRAEAILAYRKMHGDFSSTEEIMNVDGIKEGLYNRIKDNIKVN